MHTFLPRGVSLGFFNITSGLRGDQNSASQCHGAQYAFLCESAHWEALGNKPKLKEACLLTVAKGQGCTTVDPVRGFEELPNTL